ncbi:MAG: hypothetical protein ABIG89_04845 [Candidatus Woesearchaeota archaeon]
MVKKINNCVSNNTKLYIGVFVVVAVLALSILFYSSSEDVSVSDEPSKATGFITKGTGFTITNSLPTVSGILIQDADGGVVTMDLPTAAVVNELIRCSATITDVNGCNDLGKVRGYFYRSNASHATSGDSPANFGMHTFNYSSAHENSTCAVDTVENPCDGASDTSAIYNCTFTITSLLDGTVASTHFPDDDWTCTIIPEDLTGNGTMAAGNNATVEVEQNAIMSVLNGSIHFGTGLSLGANVTREMWVANYGNVGIDISVDAYGSGDGDGKGMACSPGVVPFSGLQYKMSNFILDGSGGNQTALTDSAVTITGFNLGKFSSITTNPNDDGDGNINTNKTVYIGLAVPDDGVGGACNGSIVATTVVDVSVDGVGW